MLQPSVSFPHCIKPWPRFRTCLAQGTAYCRLQGRKQGHSQGVQGNLERLPLTPPPCLCRPSNWRSRLCPADRNWKLCGTGEEAVSLHFGTYNIPPSVARIAIGKVEVRYCQPHTTSLDLTSDNPVSPCESACSKKAKVWIAILEEKSTASRISDFRSDSAASV